MTNPQGPTVEAVEPTGPDGPEPPDQPLTAPQHYYPQFTAPASWPAAPAGWGSEPAVPVVAAQPPPRRWGFGAFLLAEAVFLLSSLLVPAVAILPYAIADASVFDDGTPLPGPVLVAALTVPPLLAAAVGLLATVLRGNGPVIDLGLRFGWRDVGIGVGCGLGGVLLTIPLGLLWAQWVGEEDANSAVGEVFDGIRMPVALAIVVFLQVWLIAPICEEILYRGLLWGAMERRRWNRWVILSSTTVLFALAHLELLRAPLLLVIGLPIGLARLFSGRLAAPVVAHQINNFLPALVLMLLLIGKPIG